MRSYLAWMFVLMSPLAIAAQETGTGKNIKAVQSVRVSAAVNDSARIRLLGNTNPQVRAAFDHGLAPADLPMQRMLLVLKRSPEQQHALDEYLAAVQDKASPNYHRWLTPEQFGEMFGAAQQDIDTIMDWLRSHGLTPANVSKGRGILEFSGTAAQVAHAFRTEIRAYELNGKNHYANASDPEIPAALSPVVAGVATMHNFLSQGSAHIVGGGLGRSKLGPTRPAFTFYDHSQKIVHALVPDDLQTIYNAAPLLKAKTSGAGQKLAIAARSNVSPDDFRAFRALFQPFARQNALKIIVNGADPGFTYDDDMVEATADVQYAGAMAPDADLVLVVSSSTNDTDGIALSAMYAVDNNVAPVLSVSYGLCERAMGTAYNRFYSSLWEQAAAQGITVVVSSGDSGPAGCEQPFASGDPNAPTVSSQGAAVNGLASTPYNIAVGGTQLDENASESYWSSELNFAYGSALSYIPEIAWNESCSPDVCGPSKSNFAASSGGPSSCTARSTTPDGTITCSSHYPKPSWQSGPGVPNDNARDLPDLALSSAARDGYIICLQGSCSINTANGNFDFYVVSGTSLAGPTFGGVMALVNQKTSSAQGQAAPALYDMAAAQGAGGSQCDASSPATGFESCVFRDATQGNSDVPCAGGSPGCSEGQPGRYGLLRGYSAALGFDLVTGLGSVNVANLVNNWNSSARTATQTSLSIAPVSFTHGQEANVTISVSAQPGQAVPSGDIVILTTSTTPNAASVVRGTLTNGSFNAKLGSLPGGSYEVSARYAGDDDFSPSVAPGVAVVVRPEASATKLNILVESENKLTSLEKTVAYGSKIFLNAQARGQSAMGVPSGTMTFHGIMPPPAAPITQIMPLNNAGTVETNAILMSLGTYTFSADYSGDAGFDPSASGAVSFEVMKASTAISAVAKSGSVSSDGDVQIHVALSTTSLSQIFPSGTVAVLVGNTRLPASKVYGYADETTGFASATAELNLPANRLKSGANFLTVIYDGDEYYKDAISPTPISIDVTTPADRTGKTTKLDLSVAGTGGMSVTLGDVVTLKATVSYNSQAVEGGTVTFYNGVRPIGTVQVVGPRPATGFATGTATLKTRLPSGSNLLRARYDGLGSAYLPAGSPTVTITVTGNVPTESQLTATENQQNPANYDLTLSVLGSGVTPPSGTANFHNKTSGSDIGSASLHPAAVPFALVSTADVAVDEQPLADSVAVAVADLNSDGIPDVVTANQDDMSISVLLGKGDGMFEAASQFHLDFRPVQVIVVDANLNGIQDLIVAGADGTVSVLLGNGDGTLRAGKSYAVPEPLSGMIQGDFNADGIPDVAVYSETSPYVYVLPGAGDGTFQPTQAYLSGEVVNGLATGDFNHDGLPDLVMSGMTGLYLLTGRSEGGFTLSETRPYDGGNNYFLSQVSSPVVADFNGDGIADIAMVPNMLPYDVVVITGNADGSFQPPQILGESSFDYLNTMIDAASLTVADINADGIPDIVQMLGGASSGKSIGGLYVYFGTADGEFGPPVSFTLPIWATSAPIAIAIADLNGDGLREVVTTIRNSVSVGLTSALLKSRSTATLDNISLGASTQTIQTSYAPDAGASYASSTSNTLTLGSLIGTRSTLEYGYKTAQGSCYLGGASYSVYWNSVPCFYLHVIPTTTGAPAITGSVTLNGITPVGDQFTAGPYLVYPDGSGGAYLYIFYNYGLGDAGDYSFTASYSGDKNFQASVSSGAIILPIRPLPTSIVLSGPKRVLAGDSAVITGQLTSPVFSGVYLFGPVELYDDAVLLQESYFWSNSLIFSAPLSATGTHNILARFKGVLGRYGTLNTAASVSNSVSVDVLDRNVQPSGTIQLSVTPDPVVDATPITLQATVNGGALQNKGTITFFDGGTTLATITLTGDNPTAGHFARTATLKQSIGVGRHTITARYDGIASVTPNGAQTAAPITSAHYDLLVSTKAASDTQLAARTSTSSSRAYDLTATIFAHGAISPSGVVTFQDVTANSPLASVVLDAAESTPAFGRSKTIPLMGQAGNVAIADFDGDGVPDLVVADTTANAVHVLSGTGKGTYGSQRDYVLDGVPVVITATDINRDGVLDIVVGTANRHIDLLLGNSDGTLQPPRSLPLSFAPGHTLFGDVNGDGLTDIIAVGQAGSSSLSVLLGNGDGTFDAATNYTIPKLWDGNSAVLADLNGDSVLDILLVTNNSATYEMLGIGDGTFQPAVPFNSMNGNVIAADLNGDGSVDLAFIPSTGHVGVQLGRGDGTFTPPRYYPFDVPGTNPEVVEPSSTANSIAAADFNGDGIPDIIIPGMILLGTGDGTFRQSPVLYNGTFSALADVNGDGFPDLVNTSQGSLNVQHGGTIVSAQLNDEQIRGTGTHEIKAAFTPSDGIPYEGSTSNLLQVQAYQTEPSKLTLSPAAETLTYGDSVTVQAVVTPLSGDHLPTGSVVFIVDDTPQQSTALSSLASCQAVFDSLSGGRHSITALYSGDSSLSPSRNSLTITMQPASVIIGLASSRENSDLGKAVTFTARVQRLSGTERPAGTVTFQDGSTLLTTAPLSSGGVAAYSTSALSVGTHTVTANYSGDSNFRSATSATLTQTVVAPDFAITSNPSSLSIQRGRSGVAVISITAIGGYSGTATLACGNLPTEATCEFAPSSLNMGGATPSGAATLTVTVAAQRLAGLTGTEARSRMLTLAALLIGFPALMCAGNTRRKMRLLLMPLVVVTSATICMSGCGGGTTKSSLSSTYSVPVTVSAEGLSHTLSLTLVVH
jgi:hypothetical protein